MCITQKNYRLLRSEIPKIIFNKRDRVRVSRYTSRSKQKQRRVSNWCWWAVRPARLDWLHMAERSGCCPATPRRGQNQVAGLKALCALVRVCESLGGSHRSAPASASIHTHTQHQLHLSLTWKSLMTEAEKPKKKPPLSVSLPPFFFPPPLSFLTALPNINAPYGALWTRLFKTLLGLAHNQ